MSELTSRTKLIIGESGVAKLATAHLLVVGTGGVGGYAVELLGRAGIGAFTLVDGDTVEPSNLNRQITALHSTIGKYKTTVLAERLKEINPEVKVTSINSFLDTDDIPALLDSTVYTFIIDAIDSVGPKCRLIEEAFRRSIPIISSMGAGARIEAAAVRTGKLSDAHHDGLSKAVRKRLSGSGIPKKLDVVFSKEASNPGALMPSSEPGGKGVIGTVSWLPAIFGCHIAQFVTEKIGGLYD